MAGRSITAPVRRVLAAATRRLRPVLPLEVDGAITLESILPLLYPDVTDHDGLLSAARLALDGSSVRNTADMRRILVGLDRQVYPSPVTVRFRAEDVDVVQLPDFSLVLDRSDNAVSNEVALEEHEPHVSAILASYCKPGMSVVDIGANIGYHTMALSRLVGERGHVYAVEPNSENARMLLASAGENGAKNITLLPVALDAAQGWAYFTSHIGSNGGLLSTSSPQYVEGGGWIVPTFALDELAPDRVDLIKIDVEGAEGIAVRGARKTISRCRPVVISELSPEMLRRVSGMEPLEYLKFFSDLGYAMSIIERTQPGRLTPFGSPEELLAGWTDKFRLEDLLLLPEPHRA